MWPAVKQPFTQEQFLDSVQRREWHRWRPSKIVWHNTAAPSLSQWIAAAQADRERNLIPGISRINNLEYYFREQNRWSGCPHLFVANDFIWEMNSLTEPGVHSPSWNTTAIGIEMIGDFSTEDDDQGFGLSVKQNTVYATAVLCSALGLEPSQAVIYLHKQDPKTTHDCPGRNIAVDKLEMIASVAALMSAGEHDPKEVAEVIATGTVEKPTMIERKGVTTTDGLNFRKGPGANSESTGKLPKGVHLTIMDQAQNGETTWLYVRTPAGYLGWVASQFVKQGE